MGAAGFVLGLLIYGLLQADAREVRNQPVSATQTPHEAIVDNATGLIHSAGRRTLKRIYLPHSRNGSRHITAPEYSNFSQYLPMSVLYDGPEEKVIINALLTDDFAEALEYCVFSEDQLLDQQPLRLEAQAVERYSWFHEGDWTEYKITCFTNGSSFSSLIHPWADVELHNRTRGGYPLKPEALVTTASEGIALCGPTVYSDMPGLHDFVEHYEKLGVDEFHFYLPGGPVLDNFLANPRHSEHEAGVYSIMPGSLSTKKAEAFEHPKVRWHNFTTTPEGTSFNLRAGNNDCVSRLKYSHKYAVIADADEFLHMTKLSGLTNIRELMDKYLPESVAALGFADMHYPRDCPTSAVEFDKQHMPVHWTGSFPDSYGLHFPVKLLPGQGDNYWASHPSQPQTLPIKDNPFDQWAKSIIRVDSVFSVNYHGPELLLESTRHNIHFLPHYMAHFKHIRYRGPTLCVFGSEVKAQWLFQPHAVLEWMEP